MMSTHSIRKFKIFFKFKRTWIGLILFLVLFFSSLFANIFSNNKPLFIYLKNERPCAFQTCSSQFFFPIFLNYSPKDFGLKNSFEINYKKFLQDNKNVFYIFPLNPWNAEEQTDDILQSPSKNHILGTDNLGRDILARLLYGVRISLSFGLLLWFVSFLIGVSIGAVQGYFLGPLDFIIERIKELVSIIPTLSLIILVTGITNQQSFVMILIMVLFFAWIGISSQIRASVLSLSQQDFCLAAKAMGATHKRIIFKHILSNSFVPIITLSPFAIEGGISLLAALDYLGFGLPPPTPSIGELLAQGRDNIQNAPWVIVSPILSILILLISINLIGQALRTALDPRANASVM